MAEGELILLRRAITERLQVVALHSGLVREFCPHALGRRGSVWRVFVWQFAGESSSGRLPEWRCFDLDDLEDITLREGKWRRGRVVGDGRQHCIVEYDTRVDPAFTNAALY